MEKKIYIFHLINKINLNHFISINEPSATPIRGFLFSEDAKLKAMVKAMLKTMGKAKGKAKGDAKGNAEGNTKGNA